ncbi:MAG: hypothetical protein KGI68_07655 [Alphaproteobacteria bacterium]|jgi:hypothetical protein|nr:hypothetical protein [Alphaproteobacteria bacterium]MDE1987680.1 hypothetical protein [Alphaproteobacteria bacterium]MDE2164271.1 hypothetical protein [Alphaproteobacteria bacterium]MDE2266894.1 hypothetical protein [Alphaproteobacteria bacterium]MDE2499993.1 hypothetical protein [Alphaproteobacteria bacterium]
MVFAKKTAIVSVAAAFAGLMFVSAASAADGNASLRDCIHMSKQVADAMNAAQPGKATDDARTQQQVGRSYCAASMYNRGVQHYAKALELLNAKG